MALVESEGDQRTSKIRFFPRAVSLTLECRSVLASLLPSHSCSHTRPPLSICERIGSVSSFTFQDFGGKGKTLFTVAEEAAVA